MHLYFVLRQDIQFGSQESIGSWLDRILVGEESESLAGAAG
jgi:hypothetical protein